MANFHKNAFYDPSTTAAVTVYTCPSNANAIIQNIQVTNESGSKILKVSISDDSASTIYQIAYASITGPTICNLSKGPIVLEETDTIRLESSNISGISATIAILEINRDDQNGQ
jgi:hypothetical protein